MGDTEPAPTFLLQALAFVWIGIVVAGGIFFGILAGLPKLLWLAIVFVVASPGLLAYSVARRRRNRHYQRLIDEAFSDVRESRRVNS